METRSDDEAARELVAALNHWPTLVSVLAERAMLAGLEGGCLAPIAALGSVEGDKLTLTGRVISQDGVHLLEAADSVTLPPGSEAGLNEALRVGRQIAERLLSQGANKLIAAAQGRALRST